MLTTLRRAYAYLHWANQRVVEAARTLSAEDYVRDHGVSFRSVHGTLAHMVGSEWVWLQRWRGESPTAVVGSDRWHTVDDLEAAWLPVRTGQLQFLTELQPEDLSREVRYRNFAGEPKTYELGDVLLHVVNHATYHRGQVTSLLRQLGASPPASDYTLFLDAARPRT